MNFILNMVCPDCGELTIFREENTDNGYCLKCNKHFKDLLKDYPIIAKQK